jgi:ribosomal protein L40E
VEARTQVCSRCAAPLSPGAKFCRGCGAPTATAPTKPVAVLCTECKHANLPDSKFCRACGRRISPQATPARPRPPARVSAADQPPPEPARRRPSRLAIGAVIATVLIAGSGAAAVALLSRKTHPPARTAGATAAKVSRKTRQPARTSAAAVQTTSAGGSAPPTSPSTTANPARQTTSGPSVPATQASTTSAPAETIHQHLEDLGSGKYQQAFNLMSSSYQAQNPSWPSIRSAADPGITIISVGTPTLSPAGADLQVDFYARDHNQTSGSDTRCREFKGAVSMVKQGAAWKYNPAGNHLQSAVVPQSDPKCPS